MRTHLPRVSVVIAPLIGPRFMDDRLASLERQAKDCNAEVIVVVCGLREYAAQIARKFPWVRVIRRGKHEGVPELCRSGVEEAATEVEVIIEESAGALSQAQAIRLFAAVHLVQSGFCWMPFAPPADFAENCLCLVVSFLLLARKTRVLAQHRQLGKFVQTLYFSFQPSSRSSPENSPDTFGLPATRSRRCK